MADANAPEVETEAIAQAIKRKVLLVGIEVAMLTLFVLLQRELSSPEPFMRIRSRLKSNGQRVWEFVWPTIEPDGESPVIAAAEQVITDLLRSGAFKRE